MTWVETLVCVYTCIHMHIHTHIYTCTPIHRYMTCILSLAGVPVGDPGTGTHRVCMECNGRQRMPGGARAVAGPLNLSPGMKLLNRLARRGESKTAEYARQGGYIAVGLMG